MIKNKLLKNIIDLNNENLKFYIKGTKRNIIVSYNKLLCGGGQKFGLDYISLIKDKIGKVDRVFEWCCGPAFIGFSLLANGLCNSLCLADINPQAIEKCKETIKHNKLENLVDIYLSDGLKNIPSHESWDLVVGNPPHSKTNKKVSPHVIRSQLIYKDLDWKIHKDFYNNIKKYTSKDFNIIIQEDMDLSNLDDFRYMINDNELEIVDIYKCNLDDTIYYIHTK